LLPSSLAAAGGSGGPVFRPYRSRVPENPVEGNAHMGCRKPTPTAIKTFFDDAWTNLNFTLLAGLHSTEFG
jgi:hypothetical protein